MLTLLTQTANAVLSDINQRTMAYYNLKKKPQLTTQEGETDTLYASIVYSGTISSKQLISKVAQRSGFKEGELVGALIELLDEAAYQIGEGYIVELGDFGYFSGKVKSRLVANKDDIRSQSVHFNGVNFRASKKFRYMAQGKLERNPHHKFYQSREWNEEVLERIVTKHIEEYGFINWTTYTQLTGRLKNKALEDLKKMADKGLIERMGRGNQMHFIKTRNTAV